MEKSSRKTCKGNNIMLSKVSPLNHLDLRPLGYHDHTPAGWLPKVSLFSTKRLAHTNKALCFVCVCVFVVWEQSVQFVWGVMPGAGCGRPKPPPPLQPRRSF